MGDATVDDAAGDLQLSVLERAEELEAIQPDWQALYRAMPDRKFHQDPYWARRMWARVEERSDRTPLVIVGRVAGQIRLIWPLVMYRRRFWRVTQALSEELVDFDAIVVAPEPQADAWCRAAWAKMIQITRPDMVVCRRMPAGSAMDRLVGQDRWRWEKPSCSPYVDLTRYAGWDDYYAQLSKKTRSTIRNRRNRLARFGAVRFDAVDDAAEAERLIGWMFDEKLRRLGTRGEAVKDRMTHAQFSHDAPFLSDVTTQGFRDGQVVVFGLYADEDIVAVMTGFVVGKCLVGWLFGYDGRFMPGAPGRTLVLETIKWAQAGGMETVDFMPEPEDYKWEWTELSYGVRDVRIPTTLWGRSLVAWHRSSFRDMAKAAYLKMPRNLQALVRRSSMRTAGTKDGRS